MDGLGVETSRTRPAEPQHIHDFLEISTHLIRAFVAGDFFFFLSPFAFIIIPPSSSWAATACFLFFFAPYARYGRFRDPVLLHEPPRHVQ